MMLRFLTPVPIVLQLIAGTALAEEANKASKRQMIIEFSPFLSFVGSDLPGPYGGGVGGEMAVASHWTVGGILGYAQMERGKADMERAKEANPNDPIASRYNAYSALASARYYLRPSSNSWFLGGGVGAGRGSAEYVAGKEHISESFAGGFLACEGGYRWLWDNGLSFRVTGRGHSEAFAKHDFAPAAVTPDGSNAGEKVRKSRSREITGVVPSFHFGIGYSF